ncbi:DNA polymerase delta catalytic subunit-like protein [Dinothrombium tinctorium]|uniref:DNA polymerase delta catalytic subunit n=1 Tax=Dinothrombium tinctorium TaxID=1965070 RepID=A0A3S3NUB0_9ACAR|nr:DNA polymerase delta catalytic subunit-like protein [Dinothrombium tinctorium]
MVDRELRGCSWVKLRNARFRNPKHSEFPKVSSSSFSRSSFCQLEIDVRAEDVIVCTDASIEIVQPLLVLAFDIECMNTNNEFPKPERDAVIQISNVVWNSSELEPRHEVLFALNSVETSSVDFSVYSFKRESEMLAAWADFVRTVDPDVVTGYNIQDFDIWYLLSRAQRLGLERFAFLGRLRNVRSVVRDVKFKQASK